MDLIRVARSKGDFPGKVPHLAHGPLFPALRSDAINHAAEACLQVAPKVFPSTVAPSAFSASRNILREESLLASIVQGTFADWHLASMVHQWIQQDQQFCYGHTDNSEITAKDKNAVMGLGITAANNSFLPLPGNAPRAPRKFSRGCQGTSEPRAGLRNAA